MSKKNDPIIAKLQKSIDANIAELEAGPGPHSKQYALERYRRERAGSGQANVGRATGGCRSPARSVRGSRAEQGGDR
jgi:hypothetical protein